MVSPSGPGGERMAAIELKADLTDADVIDGLLWFPIPGELYGSLQRVREEAHGLSGSQLFGVAGRGCCGWVRACGSPQGPGCQLSIAARA